MKMLWIIRRCVICGMVNEQDVRILSDLDKPVVSPASHYVHYFIADIDRDGAFQEVGYVIWKSIDPSFSIEGAPAGVIKFQRAGEKALEPMTQWFHSLKGHQLEKRDVFEIQMPVNGKRLRHIKSNAEAFCYI
jgi:hypothetical protein